MIPVRQSPKVHRFPKNFPQTLTSMIDEIDDRRAHVANAHQHRRIKQILGGPNQLLPNPTQKLIDNLNPIQPLQSVALHLVHVDFNVENENVVRVHVGCDGFEEGDGRVQKVRGAALQNVFVRVQSCPHGRSFVDENDWVASRWRGTACELGARSLQGQDVAEHVNVAVEAVADMGRDPGFVPMEMSEAKNRGEEKVTVHCKDLCGWG